MSHEIRPGSIRIHPDPEAIRIQLENNELLAEGLMMCRGGLTKNQLMGILVGRGHLIRIETFADEVEALFRQKKLRKPIPKGSYLIPWTEREKVYLGNIEKENQPSKKW